MSTRMENPNPHSVFQEHNDHFNWDKYIEQIDLIELSNPDKRRAKEALKFLRSILGDNFLKKGFRTGHVVCRELANSAPVARLRLIRFVDLIRTLKKFQGIDDFLKYLRRPDDFVEISTVLDTAAEFSRTGFTISFEPSVPVTSVSGKVTRKRPDLLISNPAIPEKIFVEVSRLRRGEAQLRSEVTFNTIWGLLHNAMMDSVMIEVDPKINSQIHHHILPLAVIFQNLDDEELVTIVKRIKKLIEKVFKTNRFQELTIEGKIEVAISPRHDHSQVEKWARSRQIGVEHTVDGPPILLNEIHRARIKISDKIKQLPRDELGIIVIYVTETLMLLTHNLSQIMTDIENELHRYPHLYCVVLTSQMGESGKDLPKVVRVENHLFIAKKRDDLVVERKVVIFNPTFKLHLGKLTTDIITQSLIGIE